MHGEDGILRIQLDNKVPEEGAPEPKPERRGTHMPAPQGLQQGPYPEIDIGYLSHLMDVFSHHLDD